MTSYFSFRSTVLSLSKNTSLFLLTRVVGVCISIGLLPLFTRYLSPYEYGIIAILDSTVEIFSAFFAIVGGRVAIRFYHDAEDDLHRRRVISTSLIISSVLAFCAILLLIFLYRDIAFIAFKSYDYDKFLFLAVFSMLIGIPGGIASAVLVASSRSRLVCIVDLIRVLFGALLRIYLVVFLKQGIDGVLWTNFTCAALFGFGLAVWLIFSVGFSINRSLIRPMLRYGLPFAPMLITTIAMNSLNRFFLKAYGTAEQVAHYQLAFQLPFTLSTMILGSFDQFWSANTIFTIAKTPNALNQYTRVSTYFLSFLSFILFSVAISANILVKIFAAPSYGPAALYIPFIAFGLWFYAFHTFVRTGVYLSTDTYLIAINHGLTLLATILFNWLFISRFGTYGAAYACIVIYLFFSMAGGMIYKGFKYIELRKLTTIAILWATLVLIRYQIGTYSIYTDICCNLFFAVLYLVLMFYFPFCISKEERSDIVAFIKLALNQKRNILQIFKS